MTVAIDSCESEHGDYLDADLDTYMDCGLNATVKWTSDAILEDAILENTISKFSYSDAQLEQH